MTTSVPGSSSAIFNTVFVFDFDDTLFPTKKFCEIEARMTSEEKRKFRLKAQTRKSLISKSRKFMSMMTYKEMVQFRRLSCTTYRLLSSYIKKYSRENIYVVTASSSDWMVTALFMVYEIGFYSDIYQLLFPQNMHIDDSSSIYQMSPEMRESIHFKPKYKGISRASIWKYDKFADIIDKRANKTEANKLGIIINTFVFIGDSKCEYDAAGELRKDFAIFKITNTYVHRIKMMKNSGCQDLMVQQDELIDYYADDSYPVQPLLDLREFDVICDSTEN